MLQNQKLKSPCRKESKLPRKTKTAVKEVLRRDILQQVAVMVAAKSTATDCPEWTLGSCASE